MKGRKKTTSAVEILHRRYIGEDPERKASLQAERINGEIANMIYELRKGAGLTQEQLADLIGTTQSVISRLEDADYEGHSLSMLNRIAQKLNQRLAIQITKEDQNLENIRYVFNEVLKGLRKEKGLTIEQFVKKSGIDYEDAVAIECNCNYKPTPLMLHKLSDFYGISQRKLAYLAGAFRDVPSEIQEKASKFAAQALSFSKLTDEERSVLDEFVRFLRTEMNE